MSKPISRELAISERTTEDLKARLSVLKAKQPLLMVDEWAIEDLELELEEREECERKVSRW